MNKPFSPISFGGASLSGEGGGYGFGEMSESEAEKLIKASWEAGITVFDTAPIYGFGLSEERLGRYLPKDATVITKGGVGWHPTKRVNMSNDPVLMEKQLLESLKRLNRDHVSVYMIHWPDPKVDIRSPLEILNKYQEKGVIGEIGLCNTILEDLAKAESVSRISFLQSELNLLNTSAFDRLQNKWKNYHSLSWGTLDKGILSGRVTADRKYDRHDARGWAPWWNKKEVREKIERVGRLKTILDDYSLSLSHFCLHFNLNYYGIDSCLIGLKNNNDLVELTSNLQKIIPEATMEEVFKRWNN